MMKRFVLAVVLLLSSLPAYGQGSVMPIPLAQWFDNNGAVLTSGGLCVWRAGTSTAATTYTTAALSVANTNPILFSNGRATSGGVFLAPGASYKFELRDYAATVGSPTCGAGVGATIWTVDNVSAVPGSSSSVEATGTAGESLAAGDAVFLSNGTNGLTGGQWYKTDSDLIYKSTGASLVGLAPIAILSGATGSIQLSGSITVAGPLSTGAAYYAGSTAGAIVASPPTNAIRIGTAQSPTVLILGFTDAPIGPRGPPCGRLTLTTGTPVTVADVTAATTVFYAPYGGCNQIELFDGTTWTRTGFPQVSIAVPATTATVYDVFAFDSAGVVTLELTAWTNDTTRATALTTQNGVYVKTGVLTRLYLGSFRTTAVSGQTEDSFAKRYVWNYYNRVQRAMRVTEATDSWTYDTGTYRQANGAAANQLDCVIGVAEVQLSVVVYGAISHNVGATAVSVSVGEDSTTTSTTGTLIHRPTIATGAVIYTVQATLVKYPAVGRHFYAWLESGGGATTTWYGDNGGATSFQSGIQGWIEG